MITFGLILAGAACGAEGVSGTSGEVKATWIQAQVVENSVSIPVSEVDNNNFVQFEVPAGDGQIAFMAYDLNGNIIVRANVCPPCHSSGFSLDGDKLVCSDCATTFEASTGKGISGVCADYPKDSVTYKVIDGTLIMDGNDLVTAYQNTIQPG